MTDTELMMEIQNLINKDWNGQYSEQYYVRLETLSQGNHITCIWCGMVIDGHESLEYEYLYYAEGQTSNEVLTSLYNQIKNYDQDN